MYRRSRWFFLSSAKSIRRRGHLLDNVVAGITGMIGMTIFAALASAAGIAERYAGLKSEDFFVAPLVEETKVVDQKVFTEGPAVATDGRVYFTNASAAKILVWNPQTHQLTTFRENSGEANGLLFDHGGALLACEGKSGRVTRTDLASRKVTVLADKFGGHPLGSPNDLTIDARGRVYFTSRLPNTDPKQHNVNSVYRIDTDGKVSRILREPDIHMPNGVEISPDGRTLYLIESDGREGRNRCILAYDLKDDGAVTNARRLFDFYPGRGGDGLCVDTNGNLYVAAGLHQTRGTHETLDTRPGIHVISPSGQLLAYLATPTDTLTNCTFGGPDRRTLFITCGDRLLSVRTKHAGPMPKPYDDKDREDKDYSAELPRIASKSPEESLKAMKLKAGFHAEIVAAEPLIRSPMAMDFDEFGRAFVVELPEYNQYASPKPHGHGDIKMLTDTDGDGRFDKATVYVSNLDYPTAVACWDGGILVGVAPDILFCKDTDGDGQADIRKKLFTGFGTDKAGEGMLNSFRWRIDNRFHIPCGLDGGEITRVGEPEGVSPRTETKSQATNSPGADATRLADKHAINVRGQNLLLEPRAMTITATSGGGQHGMSLDDWNLRAFVCGNSEPVHLIMYDGQYLARNPYLQAPAAAINIAPDGKFTKLMRISPVEPWRVLRTRLRSKGIIPGSDEGGTPSGFFTGATGITVYRGDAWPAEYRGQVFVGEVANNLVYRARLEPNGVGLTAHRADKEAEFLASADNWFRPVQFANAPDGSLYVLDMYRELIEGAAFLAPQILKHMDPSAGFDKGRIYRIAPDGFQFKTAPRLGDLPSTELVKLFEHPNSWHRDTASRLIYQRQDRTAIAPLRVLAENSKSPLARTMALHSLNGLSALEPELVTRRMATLGRRQAAGTGNPPKADHPPELQHALRLAELFADRPEVRETVLPLADDADLRVRYQAAFTLGAFNGDAATQALKKIAVREGSDPWMQLAILSSVGHRRGEFLAALLSDHDARKTAHIRTMLSVVASQIGAANMKEDFALFVRQLDALAVDVNEKPLAEELVKNLVSKQPSAREFLSGATGGKATEILAAMIRDAQATARNEKNAPADRVAAVRTLASANITELKDLFAELLQSRQPQPVQAAALETLARFDSLDVASLVLAAWPSQTPQLRATAIETLFTRPKWIIAFLDAVEKQAIARADLDPARVALLQKHNNAGIRTRASKLFAEATLARRQDVVDAYQKSLELKGDVDRGRTHFRKTCAACHKLEGFGESIGAELNAIRDRGTAAVLLNILDPNREVKPQFLNYVVVLDSGRTLTGMIATETANSLTLRKPDNTNETILRVNIEELKSTGLSFMPEGLEKQLDVAAMADVLAYLNSIK